MIYWNENYKGKKIDSSFEGKIYDRELKKQREIMRKDMEYYRKHNKSRPHRGDDYFHSISDDEEFDKNENQDEVMSSRKLVKSEFSFREKRIIERACKHIEDLFPADIVDIERVGDGKYFLKKNTGEVIKYDSYEDIIESSRKPVADVNFYKNVVRSVLSNRRSEESAIHSIAIRNKCNIGYAKNIFNNYMNKYQDELIRSDVEIADIHKDFNVDGDLNSWAEDYMPGSGKANTKGGELVRAAQRILTEYYDGGNMIGRGLGNETVNPAARYIVKNTSYEGNDEIEDMLNHVVRMDDGEYDSWLKRFENDFADWLRGNEELFAEPNDDDIADYAEDDDREVVLNKFYVEDSSGNQYFFRNDDDKFVCTGVEFAQDPVYYENDIFTDGDELSSDIDKTEDYGLVEKDGFSYDWEAVGNTDDNGNYSEWRVVRMSIADQLFEVDDVLDIEDMENYSVFDVNGNKIEEKDFMAL